MLKDILVYLDTGEDCEARCRTAIKLALKHDSRLIGVDISTTQAHEGNTQERALEIEGKFASAAGGAGLSFEFHTAPPGASSAKALFSHCADIIVSTQPHPDRLHLTNPHVPKDVLLSSGVPMLVLPTGWSSSEALGKRVVVSFNFSRESMLALHGALPILEAADRVFICIFASDFDAQDIYVQALQNHLARHGVRAEIDGWRAGVGDPVACLFANLDREGADLIVSGAFGHSSWYEEIFGGVTRDLLTNISMPVLMSH